MKHEINDGEKHEQKKGNTAASCFCCWSLPVIRHCVYVWLRVTAAVCNANIIIPANPSSTPTKPIRLTQPLLVYCFGNSPIVPYTSKCILTNIITVP